MVGLKAWFIQREVRKRMPSLLTGVAKWILGVLPGEGVRTAFIGVAGILYALLGVITGHLSPENAGVVAVGSIGLLTSAAHKPK